MTVSTVLTEKKTIGDLIRHEYNPLSGYTRKTVTVYNRTGSAVTYADLMGYPIKVDSSVATAYKLAVYGDEATVLGLLIPKNGFKLTALANGSSFVSVALVNGPAIIDKTVIPTTDVSGGTFVLATLVTTLAGLNPQIKANAEQTVATQTT